MTLPVLNNAKCCVFFATGASKAEAIREIMINNKELPAGLVKPHNGELYWILDNESAKLLPEEYLKKMSVTVD